MNIFLVIHCLKNLVNKSRMKIYYYLLYRLYFFYTNTLGKDDQPLLTTSIMATLLIWFNFLTIYGVLRIYSLIPKIDNYFLYLLFMMLVLLINYFLIRGKRFLYYNFKRGQLGGLLVLFYTILTIGTFLYVANKNRAIMFSSGSLEVILHSGPNLALF